MGTTLSRRLFQHVSKSNVNDHCQSSVEDKSDSNNISSTDVHFFEEVVPERYLALLTEQMSAILFRLMNINETSILLSENGSDQRIISSYNISNDDRIGINSIDERSSLELQTIHRSCMKCRMKLLTIEEFYQLHQAFHRLDSNHDHYLNRNEIHIVLNNLFELTETDIEEFLSVFDRNEDERISIEEYIEEIKHRLLHKYTREEIKLAFDQADLQKNGHLSLEELEQAIEYLNLHLPHQRIIEIVHDFMKDKSTDSIDFIRFTNIVQILHRREPITSQKFKAIHHHKLMTNNQSSLV